VLWPAVGAVTGRYRYTPYKGNECAVEFYSYS
jgi:hypothetical protein